MSGYELNEDGIFVDIETGEPAPVEPVPRPQFEELVPQWLMDQHNDTKYPPA